MECSDLPEYILGYVRVDALFYLHLGDHGSASHDIKCLWEWFLPRRNLGFRTSQMVNVPFLSQIKRV